MKANSPKTTSTHTQTAKWTLKNGILTLWWAGFHPPTSTGLLTLHPSVRSRPLCHFRISCWWSSVKGNVALIHMLSREGSHSLVSSTIKGPLRVKKPLVLLMSKWMRINEKNRPFLLGFLWWPGQLFSFCNSLDCPSISSCQRKCSSSCSETSSSRWGIFSLWEYSSLEAPTGWGRARHSRTLPTCAESVDLPA